MTTLLEQSAADDGGGAVSPVQQLKNFHMAIDLKRSAPTAHSAEITMSGLNAEASHDQIRLQWQGITSDATANKSYKPSAVFVLCNYACVVELRAECVIFAD